MAAPKRAKLRRDIVEPIVAQSSKETVDPNRLMPNTENADPNRAKLRRDIDEPK
jgi:hypothetical protein